MDIMRLIDMDIDTQTNIAENQIMLKIVGLIGLTRVWA
jgi:hypothetical protein